MWSLDLIWRWRRQIAQESDENHGLMRGQREQVALDLVDQEPAPVIEPHGVLFELGREVWSHGFPFFRNSIPAGVTAHTAAFLRLAVILLPPVSYTRPLSARVTLLGR